jgi:uncharacterized membrane protein
MIAKRWKDKKTLKLAIKICLFLVISSIPFISITQMIGIDTFLDSFENSEYYHCFKDEVGLYAANTIDKDYLLIQESRHPDFSAEKNDYIIYLTNDNELACNRVYHVSSIGKIKRYHTQDKKFIGHHVLENQVLGKVIKVVDENIWNSISISIWEISIQNLNIRALIAE